MSKTILKDSKQPSGVFCPKCNTNVTPLFYRFISEVTEIPLTKFKSSTWVNELKFKLALADLALQKTGIEIDQNSIASLTLQHVERLLASRLSEEERERYESDLEELQKRLDEANERNKLNEELMQQVPHLKGKEQEISIVKQLESISRHTEDEFIQEEEDSLGEDIRCRIIDRGLLIEELLIESKNTGVWKKQYVEQLKGDLRKRSLHFGMVSSTTLPKNALNRHLYITKEGIWIVSRDATPVAYRARREFIIMMRKREYSEKQSQEAMKLFTERVLSEDYQGRLSKIIDAANTVERTANTIQKTVQGKCSTLRNQAEIIRGRIDELSALHEEILNHVQGGD